MKILLDTNVVLDLLCRRGPWLADAEPIWQAALDGRIEVCLTATLTVTGTPAWRCCRRISWPRGYPRDDFAADSFIARRLPRHQRPPATIHLTASPCTREVPA